MLCEPFPIRDLVSLSIYKSKGCNTVAGDLYISSLPSDVSSAALLDGLKTVRVIQGHLFVMHNQFLPAMTFLVNLQRVDGIRYINNPILVDAHMHGLENTSIPTHVEGCPRLCPARYTNKTNSGLDESGCANPRIRFYLVVTGNATKPALDMLGDVMARVMRSKTQGQVRYGVFLDKPSHISL